MSTNTCYHVSHLIKMNWGFPGGSDTNKSTCNAADPGSISGSGKSPEETVEHIYFFLNKMYRDINFIHLTLIYVT